MAKKVDLQERLNMRFLTAAYSKKQETYGTGEAPTGIIALDILNLPDYILEDLLDLTEPMIKLVDVLNTRRNPDKTVLALMLTASKNVFQVVDLLRNVPPFSCQDFIWLDAQLPRTFSPEAAAKAYRERKRGTGEIFIQALCLIAQLGFGIRDFRKALIPLVESLDDKDVSRNPEGFAQQFDAFFATDVNKKYHWMSFTNVTVEYLSDEKGLVRRMHYASFPSMFRSDLYEDLAVGNAPRRCPICKKFFLTTNARRQVYCEGYAPEEYGGLSCLQVGKRMGREFRQKAKETPAIARYKTASNTISKRAERETLDERVADEAKALARDRKDMALAIREYAAGDYKNEMEPDALIAAATEK